VVELYGGKVDRVGKDRLRAYPFSLEPTENNIKFPFSFSENHASGVPSHDRPAR